MRLTPRDLRLLRDITLSHALSRDQCIGLGYFSSVTRANTRLRELREMGIVRPLATPFFGQFLYTAGPAASRYLPEQVAMLLKARCPSPRFLQHALATTEVRLALLRQGGTEWRFEPQLHCSFRYGGRPFAIRPDGGLRLNEEVVYVETDLGHVGPRVYAEKLRGYAAFALSGEVARIWGSVPPVILTVTTGRLRKRRLEAVTPSNAGVCVRFATFADLGIKVPGGWS